MSGRGKFITLEGVDGAGKSTHLQFVADALAAASGRHVIVTREPGGTDIAERLRQTILNEPMQPLAETLLLFAARIEHVTRVIEPALAAGTWVVCDRFHDATVAYQGAGKGVALDLIERLREAAYPALNPDRTLLFDCDYETARTRLDGSRKSLDRFEREDRAFFDRVRRAYLALARAEGDRIRIIDAAVNVEAIRQQLRKALSF